MADAEAEHSTTNGVHHGDEEDDEVVVPKGSNVSVTAEQGLKHLLLTVDVERLYRFVMPFDRLCSYLAPQDP